MSSLMETALLREWLPRQRFFGGTASDVTDLRILSRRRFATAEQVIVDTATTPYQLWFPAGSLSAATTPSKLVDVLTDAELALPLLQELAPRLGVAPPTQVAPFSGEQSNSSLVCDGTQIWKFFRQVHSGLNPDAELTGALTAACDAESASVPAPTPVPAPVPRLLGHWTEQQVTFAMAQQLVPGAQDGWELALSWSAEELTQQAEALGAAVAQTHRLLAAALPTATAPAATIASGFHRRLNWAAELVPQLAERAPEIQAVYTEVAALPPVPVQRIHGDLHLGQVLFDGRRWLLIDFEGEPARPWAQRRELDSPLRDVAGVLRSFSYAAATRNAVNTSKSEIGVADSFLVGYGLGMEKSSTTTANTDVLLRGYVLDKAVYECAYEALHRPEWLTLPLTAIGSLLSARSYR